MTVPLTNLLPIEQLRRGRSLAFDIVARLKPGVSLKQARAHLEMLWPGIQKATISPDWNALEQKEFLSWRLRVGSAATGAGWASYLRQFYAKPLVILMALVGVVLLIACANLAGLLLARGAARQREMAVRRALGAPGWKLIRQLLIESLLLSLAGALAGVLLAKSADRILVNFMSVGRLVPLALDFRSDFYVLGFTTIVAVLAGILFGLTPALRAAHADPAGFLPQHSPRLGGIGRVGRLLVSIQVALSLISLIVAGLLVRSLQNLRSEDPGFPAQGLLIMLLNQKPGGYKNFNRTAYYHDLVDRLSAMPGVSSVCLASGLMGLPREYYKEPVSKRSEGVSAGSTEAVYHTVSPRFFETLGIPLLAGRDFSWRDDPQVPRVAIISQSLAKQLFPSSDPIGQHIRIGTSPENQDLLIIGVAGNIRFSPRRNPTTAAVYLAHLQDKYNQPFVHVRTRGEPLALASSLRHQVEELGREYPLHTTTFSDELDRSLLPERLIAMLSGFFGLLALALASIGLYGLLSYRVTCRTAELGIRMALGAEATNIVWLVLRETLLLVSIGLAIGLPITLATARLISNQLFGLTPTDPITIAVAALVLVAVALFAGYLPARRASRVDPMVALRYE